MTTLQQIFYDTESLKDQSLTLRTKIQKRIVLGYERTKKTAELMAAHAGITTQIARNEQKMKDIEFSLGTLGVHNPLNP